MPLISGTPTWQKVATFVLLLAILLMVLFIYDRAGSTNASVRATEQSSERRDCVTTLQTARRSVFDNVDIYKAIQIDQLSTALLNAQSGEKATPEVVAAFQANAVKLHDALAEARRLQPSKTLDQLIARGGTVAGIHYPACPN